MNRTLQLDNGTVLDLGAIVTFVPNRPGFAMIYLYEGQSFEIQCFNTQEVSDKIVAYRKYIDGLRAANRRGPK